MKYIYLVTWTIIVAAECHDYKPDEFGNWPTGHCSAGHYKSIPMSKEFFIRDSAVAFFDRGNWAMPNQMKIDSVLIENK